MIDCQSNPDVRKIFAWHVKRYAESAARQSLIAAGEVESSDPSALIAFARYRFDDVLNRFTASFLDSADGIPGFLPAARRAMWRRP
jgi:hypothetical protein